MLAQAMTLEPTVGIVDGTAAFAEASIDTIAGVYPDTVAASMASAGLSLDTQLLGGPTLHKQSIPGCPL